MIKSTMLSQRSFTESPNIIKVERSPANMPKQGKKSTTIPLHCTLCPKNPQFSDISHLLTHISSKGHLSHRFKLQIRSQGEPEARRQLDTFETWYAENNLEDLLSERLAAKEQKKTVKRVRSGAKTAAKNGTIKTEAQVPQSIVFTPVFRPPVPRMQLWSTSAPMIEPSFGQEPAATWNQKDLYATPTMKRFVPNFPQRQSPEEDNIHVHISPPKLPEAYDADGDGSKLKGVFWPGMNLFDSATTEMKRMRNQRKDGTILAQMKSTSLGVEPNEYIYTLEGEFQRVRDIFDSSTETSPAKSERPPTPKKRRVRKTKAVPDDIDETILIGTNANKRTRSKKTAARRKPETVTTGDTLNGSRQGLQGSFEGVDEANYQFGLAVEDQATRRKFNIFRDAEEVISPGRTESPLDDHGYTSSTTSDHWNYQYSNFESHHGLPLEPMTSNRMIQASPGFFSRPLPSRFDGKENLEPEYLTRRPASAPNGYPPQVFHNHTSNPLVHHSFGFSFGYGEPTGFRGDAKPPGSFFNADYKTETAGSSYSGPAPTGTHSHSNDFARNGLNYAM